ncbi:TPA: hypothetical protein N0F65_009989, partial [Lagenidium giganteum]
MEGSDETAADAAPPLLRGQSCVQLDSVAQASVDLHMSDPLDDPETALQPEGHAVIHRAVSGLFDTMLPDIVLLEVDLVSSGDLVFTAELSPTPCPLDRHDTSLVAKREQRKSVPSPVADHVSSRTSPPRAPSRVSSRAHSRAGARSPVSTNAIRGPVLALKVAHALNNGPESDESVSEFGDSTSTGGAVLHPVVSWHDSNSDSPPRSRGGGSRASARHNRIDDALSSARFSTNGLDYEEQQRREAILASMAQREREAQAATKLQRRVTAKLKLRSLADPTISLEKEEAMSGEGRRGMGTRGAGRVVASTQEITYRPEDYAGIASDLLVIDRAGGLVVGENCMVVAKKTRAALLDDLYEHSVVHPRISVPSSTTTPTARGTTASIGKSQSVPELRTSTASNENIQRSRRPLKREKDASNRLPHPIFEGIKGSYLVHPMFEGIEGSYLPYPRIAMDPKRTPLAKGVSIKDETPDGRKRPTAMNPTGPLKAVPHGKIVHKSVHMHDLLSGRATPGQLMNAQELKANEAVELQMRTSITQHDPHIKRSPIASITRPMTQQVPRISSDSSLHATTTLRHTVAEKDVLNSRTRTPAFRYRASKRAIPSLNADISIDDWDDPDPPLMKQI